MPDNTIEQAAKEFFAKEISRCDISCSRECIHRDVVDLLTRFGKMCCEVTNELNFHEDDANLYEADWQHIANRLREHLKGENNG